MTFIRTLLGGTASTAVVGTIFYYNCDSKTKEKLRPTVEFLKKGCPYINCPVFNKEIESVKDTVIESKNDK